jgi:hypothetical protein
MAPIEEAGQPIVVGGVVIEHEDQKVTNRLQELRYSSLICNPSLTKHKRFSSLLLTSGQTKKESTLAILIQSIPRSWESSPILTVR